MYKRNPFEVELSLQQLLPYLDGVSTVYDLARKAGLELCVTQSLVAQLEHFGIQYLCPKGGK